MSIAQTVVVLMCVMGIAFAWFTKLMFDTFIVHLRRQSDLTGKAVEQAAGAIALNGRLLQLLGDHCGGLNGQARNPAGLPDSSGDLATAGGIAGVDITDHRRQVGTPHDGTAIIPQQQTSGSNISNNCPQNTTQEKT